MEQVFAMKAADLVQWLLHNPVVLFFLAPSLQVDMITYNPEYRKTCPNVALYCRSLLATTKLHIQNFPLCRFL